MATSDILDINFFQNLVFHLLQVKIATFPRYYINIKEAIFTWSKWNTRFWKKFMSRMSLVAMVTFSSRCHYYYHYLLLLLSTMIKILLLLFSIREKISKQKYLFQYKNICFSTKKYMSITISRRTRLSTVFLFARRRGCDFDEDVALLHNIRRELHGPGSLLGYSQMWQTLSVKYHMNDPRSFLHEALRNLGQEGCATRN